MLNDDATIDRGSLVVAIPKDVVDLACGSTSALPHLLLVGDSDAIADHDALARLAQSLPRSP